MLDHKDRIYSGSVQGHAFSCYVDGTLFIGRVSDFVRDEARLQAAAEFLHASRMLRLPKRLRDYWQAVHQTTVITNFVQRGKA